MAGRYAIQGVPQMQRQTGPLGTIGNFAIQRGLQHGLDMYAPGAGTFGGDLARELAPGLVPRFNMGGPLGGGLRNPQELQQARQLGALSQKEYLEALKHMGGKTPQYKEEGGGIHIKKGNEGKFTAKAKAAGMGVQEYARKVLASDSASPATKKQANFARNAAKWHHEDGGKIGPLAKTVHKMSDGETYEMNYHNPLAAKPAGDSK